MQVVQRAACEQGRVACSLSAIRLGLWQVSVPLYSTVLGMLSAASSPPGCPKGLMITVADGGMVSRLIALCKVPKVSPSFRNTTLVQPGK